MSAILNPNPVYKDEDGEINLSIYLDRLWVHTLLNTKINHKFIRKAWNVLDALEDNLKSRGFKRYYTAVDTEEQFRFASNFGFNATDELLNINHFHFEIMSKDII